MFHEDELFRALVHPTRRRIIEYLSERNAVTFSELTKSTDLNNHGKFGFHLWALRTAGLVGFDLSKKRLCLTERGQLLAEILLDTRFLIARERPHIRTRKICQTFKVWRPRRVVLQYERG